MNLRFEKGTLANIDCLMKAREIVLREVFSLAPNKNIDAILEANRNYYLVAFKHDTHIAFVSFDGEDFVGCGDMCLQHEMPSPDNLSGKCGFVMNIYTHPDYRKQGMGRKMMQTLIDEARSRGIEKLTLEASHAGRKLYASCGFTPFEDCMIKYLR